MPSVGSFIAQRKSKKLVCTQNASSNQTDPEWGPYWFPQSAINTWYTSNAANITKVTDTVYIVKDGADYDDVLDDLDDTDHIDGRRTFTDMGKTLYIGNTTNADLVVFQLVQIYGPIAAGGLSGAVGYIVVENNTRDAGGTTDGGRFKVRVARI